MSKNMEIQRKLLEIENEGKKINKKIVFNIVSVVLIAVLTIFCILYIHTKTNGIIIYDLYVGGQYIGSVENYENVRKALDLLTVDFYLESGKLYYFNDGLDYKIKTVSDIKQCLNVEQIKDNILKYGTVNIEEAYSLFMDNVFVATCKTKEDIDNAISDIEKYVENKYAGKYIHSIKLSNNIEISSQLYIKNEILSEKQLFDILKTKIGSTPYISGILYKAPPVSSVQQVSSISGEIIPVGIENENEHEKSILKEENEKTEDSISEETSETTIVDSSEETSIIPEDTTKEEVKNEDNIITGFGSLAASAVNEEIDYGINRSDNSSENLYKEFDYLPELSFYYSLYESEEVSIPHETEYQYTDKRFTWYSKKVSEGTNGSEKIIYEVTYRDNEIISKKEIGREIITEKVNEVILTGSVVQPSPGSVGKFMWPLILEEYPVITSQYGEQREEFDGDTYHFGVDIKVDLGTNVYASDGGTVIYAATSRSYGSMIIIEHKNGFTTRYAHLSEILCEIGDVVAMGDIIALSGNSGVSTAPHLHFEIRVDDIDVDPLNYLASYQLP